MLVYQNIRKDPRQFLSLTSLHAEEFEFLCLEFEKDWLQYCRYYTLRGKRRKFPSYQDHGKGSLKTTEQKLFFLLVYLKQYPPQQFQAASFGISIGKTNEWITCLLKILQITLKRLELQPCRDGSLLKELLEKMQVSTVILDASEREIQRSGDYEVQKEYYSGKKKTIRLKTTCW